MANVSVEQITDVIRGSLKASMDKELDPNIELEPSARLSPETRGRTRQCSAIRFTF